jgi:hypothetical protein
VQTVTQPGGGGINDAENVLAGRYVVSIDRIEPLAHTLQSLAAATLALITRVQAAR